MKTSTETLWKQTHDFPAWCAVPQPPAPPRTPLTQITRMQIENCYCYAVMQH